MHSFSHILNAAEAKQKCRRMHRQLRMQEAASGVTGPERGPKETKQEKQVMALNQGRTVTGRLKGHVSCLGSPNTLFLRVSHTQVDFWIIRVEEQEKKGCCSHWLWDFWVVRVKHMWIPIPGTTLAIWQMWNIKKQLVSFKIYFFNSLSLYVCIMCVIWVFVLVLPHLHGIELWYSDTYMPKACTEKAQETQQLCSAELLPCGPYLALF